MKTFIYFSQGEWRTFQAEELPVKPDFKSLKKDHVYKDYKFYTGYKDADVMQQYESEIDALKAKSLKVGNPDFIGELRNGHFYKYGMSAPVIEGQIQQWPGTVEVKEHTPLGCETWADMEFVAILLNR